MGNEREDIRKRETQLDLRVWFWVAIVGFCFTLINVSSLQIEAAREGAAPLGLAPWITEISSLIALLAIMPFLAHLSRSITLLPESWGRAVLGLTLGSIVFSLVHIALMVVLRKIAWPILLDAHYIFFGDVVREIIYEYRKDLGTYFLLIGTLILVRTLAQQSRELEAARAEAKKTGRLSLKCGARTIHMVAEDFVYAESAGNYVDVFTGTGQHLVRTSLTALQKQLEAAGIQALRIHRTRLVSANAIRETRPAGSGDLNVTLQDGTLLRASRRYRDNLAGLNGATN